MTDTAGTTQQLTQGIVVGHDGSRGATDALAEAMATLA